VVEGEIVEETENQKKKNRRRVPEINLSQIMRIIIKGHWRVFGGRQKKRNMNGPPLLDHHHHIKSWAKSLTTKIKPKEKKEM